MRKFASKIVLALLALALVGGMITVRAEQEVSLDYLVVYAGDAPQQRNLVIGAEAIQGFTYLIIEHTRDSWNDFVYLTLPGWAPLAAFVTHESGRVIVDLAAAIAEHGTYDERYGDRYEEPDFTAIRLSVWGGWEEGAITRIYLSGPIAGAAAEENGEEAPATTPIPATGFTSGGMMLIVSGLGLVVALGALAGAVVYKKKK